MVEPIDASKLACGITWDSRAVSENDLFIALPGERSDGHHYVEEVLTKGACVVLIEDTLSENARVLAKEMGAAIIEVSNTQSALTDLARSWRSHLRGKVIGITGSTGKTTTKELIKNVLQTTYSVVATEGNQNNELGVPVTLLSADPDTDYVVVEMGMRGTGQIAELCEFVKPDWGLITNVGESHIELLGSRENIARAKAELLECVPAQVGIAYLNADDPSLDTIVASAHTEARGVRVVLYDGSGTANAESADVFATDVALNDEGKPRFQLHVKHDVMECELNLRGYHSVSNAMAAASIGYKAGIEIATIVDALSHAEPVVGRQRILENRDKVTVIDDAYNASPDSMRASLVTFDAMEVTGRKIAVLGDMGELGTYAQACHEGIGSFAATLSLDLMICIGDLSRYIAKAASQVGFPEEKILQVNSISEVLSELESTLESGDAVLIKASHFMGLDRVVGGLVN